MDRQTGLQTHKVKDLLLVGYELTVEELLAHIKKSISPNTHIQASYYSYDEGVTLESYSYRPETKQEIAIKEENLKYKQAKDRDLQEKRRKLALTKLQKAIDEGLITPEDLS